MKVTGEELAKAGEKYLGRKYTEMDCQAFVERCLRDLGINLNLAGSNAWLRKMDWVGSPEECKAQFGRIPNGAFLFILERDGKEPVKYRKDGIGNASHIGIKTGVGDGAIHSSKSRGCVCTSVFKDKTINGGWNRVGLWNEIDYGLGESANSQDTSIGRTKNETQGSSPRFVSWAVVRCEDGKKVKMRNSPSLTERLYWEIPAGTVVEVLETGDRWCKIRDGSKTGYMLTSFLELESEKEAEQETEVEFQVHLHMSEIDVLKKMLKAVITALELNGVTAQDGGERE